MVNWFRRLLAPRPAHLPGAPRVLAYCAANLGTGPLLRLTRVLGQLRALRPDVSILLVTDAADTRPADRIGAAVVRLPRFVFTTAEATRERPEHLRLRNRELAALRARLIRTAGEAYAPELIYADTNPHGKRDELLPLLNLARARKTPAVLMMRDIPARPEEPFKLRGAGAAAAAGWYAQLMIAGDARWFDAAAEYGWDAALAARVRYAGFVLPEEDPLAHASRAAALAPWAPLDPARPLVVASCGGGWRADAVVPALLEALRGLRASPEPRLATAQVLMFVGLTTPPEQLATWRAAAGGLGGLVIETFSPQFGAALRHADLALIQAGSTVFQVLEGNQPVLLLTRPFKSSEQQERARRAAAWPGIRVEDLERTTPGALREWLAWGLLAPRTARATGLGFAGARVAAQRVAELLPRP